MSMPVNMHTARMAMNRDPEIRRWAEQWLKDKERASQTSLTSGFQLAVSRRESRFST
jgi:hypothetical protein